MKYFQKGQSLVELILAIGLSAILLPALLTGVIASREGKVQHGQRTYAVALLKATVEAVRSVREKGWSNFETNGTFYPKVGISGTSWELAAGTDTVDGFTKRVDISDVNRGTCPGVDCGKIVTTGGTTDPSTKKVVITVSWTAPYSSSITSTLYITRYLGNNAFLETTEAQFNLGTKSGTTVTNTGGGEVTLGAGGQGNWCTPNLSIAALDLPKQGVADAITAIEGRAFVGTGDNASGVSFANISISNTKPPVASIVGTFDGYKTNGVFGETNYAYLATDTVSKEVVIIDLTQIIGGKYQEAGSFNAPTNKKGDQVWVSGNVGYVITENKLYSFDVTNKASPQILDPDGVTVGDGTRVIVVGNYAYVTIKGSPIEVQIVDVSNPNNMVVVGWVDLTGKDAKDIFVSSTGTRAYVVTSKQDDQREFFIINIETKIGNQPVIGSYEANGMNPKALTVVPGSRAIIVGNGGEEYQVINIANEANPVRCGGLDLGAQDVEKVNGVVSVLESDGDAYAYIMTGDPNAEFKIIEGGPGGAFSISGTFESGTFDALFQTAFNRFDASVNRPVSTDIEFQVAVKQAIGGSCTGVTFSGTDFVGPSGTNADKFQTTVTSGIQVFNYAIPPTINPGQCFRYKVYLSSTDLIATPVFYDVTVNYSP